MLIKRLLAPNKNAILSAVLWTLFIVIMCFKTPSIEKRIYFPNADKIVHCSFYIGFVIVWFRYLVFKNYITTKNKVYLVLSAIVFGILIEIGQSVFTTTRQADIWDVVANTFGSLIGILFVNFISKWTPQKDMTDNC